MSTGLSELTDADVDEALERVMVPRLSALLAARKPGHCVRITDVTAPLAVGLCRRLRTALGDTAQVHVLGQPPEVPRDLAVTSTKLIELRNPDASDTQRPPLLVFIPPGTHASAEDSYGVATFEEAAFGNVYQELADRLYAGIPNGLQVAIGEVFGVLDDEGADPSAPTVGALERARYLLTVARNDNDSQAAGASVFELGLVPDFELFTDHSQVRTRATRNAKVMRSLNRADRSVRQRVIDLHLTDPAFRAKLAAFLVATGLDAPRAWTRRIVVDHTNWGLSFHRWPLPEDRTTQAVRIAVSDLDLPYAGALPDHADHPILRSITGQQYLLAGSAGYNQLSVGFEVTPDPRQVTGLVAFSVHLMSEESGPTGLRGTVKVSTTAKRSYKATLKKVRTIHLDSGWHFVRVLPIDADNVPLPVDIGADVDRTGASTHAVNESDRFYVVADNDLDEPPPRPRVLKNVGITQELRRLQFAALAEGRDWHGIDCQQAVWKSLDHGSIQASFGAHGLVEVALAPVLAELERLILAEPAIISPRRVNSTSGQPARIIALEPQAPPLTSSAPLEAFLGTRAAVMRAISGDDGMVLAGRDLLTLRESALAYAEAYAELLTRQMRQAERTTDGESTRQLAALLQIDTVIVEHHDPRGNQAQLTLVSPTHPLRLLWLVTWAELGRHWLSQASESSKDSVVAASYTLLALRPSGFPLAVVSDTARLSIAAADLTAYWGAFLPTETDNPRTLLADVAAALGVPNRPDGDVAISPSQLADRLERYVRTHPYVQTLVVCAVNAGRAEHLADTLIEMERRKTLRHLTYDIRLFTADPQPLNTGEALAELLSGGWSAAAEAETFCTPTLAGNAAKLAVAVRPLEDFRSATSRHAAHVTILFDAFSSEQLGVGPSPTDAPAPVHGLIQQMSVDYVDTDDGTVAWHKRPRHGHGLDLPGAEEYTDLLATLPARISAAAAAVTTGETGVGLVPRITLSLTPDDNTLLYQAHRSSDWVITVDRTLGVEYFDAPSSLRRPDYVIDFAPTGTDGLGHHMVVSSRSIDELRALLAPMIEQHNLQIDHRHVGTFFDQLRLLSGRLAFKIASTSPNQRTEVLGLALARLYLEYQGVLTDQILVPLDSHLELYREARRRADEVAEGVGLQRTDLALFSLDAQRRTITCRLVEVKCHSSLNSISEIQKVRDRIALQLHRSVTVLAENFDPSHASPDRLDRAIRNADLATLLRFYLDRAVRHGTTNADPAREAHWLLDHLDWGYRLEFTRSGLIFDLAGSGTSQNSEGDIEFHRIGRDLIEELIGVIPTDPVLAAGHRSESITSGTLANCDITLPRLAQAAFRAPVRSHDLPETEPPDDRSDVPPPDAPPGVALAERAAAPQTNTPSRSVVAPLGPGQGAEPGRASQSRTPDIYLGSAGPSPQYGVLGDCSGRRVALDLNETHTISLFGVQGGGKSYTLGSIIEAASLAAPPVNNLPRPLATIVFHYSPTLDYAPEFTSMIAPNTDAEQVRALKEQYGAEPAALSDVVMLVAEDQLEQRRVEYPGIKVVPLKFGSGELRATHWRFLMGALGNQSTYIRQLGRIMRANRNRLSLDVIRDGIDQSSLSDTIKQLAHQRLDLAADYIDDSVRVKDLVRPGRMIIVDLRDELIEKDEALGLFVVLMELFSEATNNGERFNKLVVFDEAHKYIESPDLVDGLIESVREMRHKGMSILIASQDPPSVPIQLIELSNHVILHKFNSPAWLKHLQKANAALGDLTSTKMTALATGEAYVWSSRATDNAFTRGAVKVQLRPRITRHGGGTKTALDGSEAEPSP